MTAKVCSKSLFVLAIGFALMTACSSHNGRRLECFECNKQTVKGHFLPPHSRYLMALGHYKHNTPNGKAIIFDNNGMIIQHK